MHSLVVSVKKTLKAFESGRLSMRQITFFSWVYSVPTPERTSKPKSGEPFNETKNNATNSINPSYQKMFWHMPLKAIMLTWWKLNYLTASQLRWFGNYIIKEGCMKKNIHYINQKWYTNIYNRTCSRPEPRHHDYSKNMTFGSFLGLS